MGRTLVALSLLSVLAAHEAEAHQDRVFPIAANGDVVGIDARFGKTNLKVNRGPAVVLRVGKNKTKLPPCLSKLFVLAKGHHMRASGSWWHRRSILAPYLVFTLPHGKSAAGVTTSYSVMFNLATAELMEVRKVTADPNSSASKVIDLTTLCSSADLAATRYRPHRPGKRTP